MSQLTVLPQILVNGILLGTMYGIGAIGLSLVFGTMRIVFIAQGAMIVFFGYLCFWLFSLWGIDPYLSLIPLILLAGLIGAAFYYGLFKEAAALKDRIGSLLIAVGIMFFLENFMMVVWSPNPRAVVTSYGFVVFNILGTKITLVRLIGLIIAIIATLGVYGFLSKTRIGTAVRATSEDGQAATLMGISPNQVNAIAFAVGLSLTSIAGVNLAATYSFDPVYGFDIAIKALVALTLGGIGTVYGGLAGGIVIGIIEVLGSYFVGAGWSQAIVFAVFLLTLTLRPTGIFGRSSQKV